MLMYALPIAAILTLACSPAQRAAIPGAASQTLYTVLMLGAALAMTVAYTGSIASAAAGEGERMHYDFVFPLMLLSSAGLLAAPEARRGVRLLWALPLAAALLLARCGPLPSLVYRWSGTEPAHALGRLAATAVAAAVGNAPPPGPAGFSAGAHAHQLHRRRAADPHHSEPRRTAQPL
jgi:hypothetical protein